LETEGGFWAALKTKSCTRGVLFHYIRNSAITFLSLAFTYSCLNTEKRRELLEWLLCGTVYSTYRWYNVHWVLGPIVRWGWGEYLWCFGTEGNLPASRLLRGWLRQHEDSTYSVPVLEATSKTTQHGLRPASKSSSNGLGSGFKPNYWEVLTASKCSWEPLVYSMFLEITHCVVFSQFLLLGLNLGHFIKGRKIPPVRLWSLSHEWSPRWDFTKRRNGNRMFYFAGSNGSCLIESGKIPWLAWFWSHSFGLHAKKSTCYTFEIVPFWIQKQAVWWQGMLLLGLGLGVRIRIHQYPNESWHNGSEISSHIWCLVCYHLLVVLPAKVGQVF
jgi:hypothetical protein